jgi:transcription termination/antitermination protein NusG
LAWSQKQVKGGSMRKNTIIPSVGSMEGEWVAVQVRLHRERPVARTLEEHGYEGLLPIIKAAPRSSRTREQVLLPGYVFCRYQERPAYRIIQAPGVLRIVGVAGRPLPIPWEELEAVQRIAESGLFAEPWRFLRSGDRVRVCAGPLAGIEGAVLYLKGEVRVVVSVTMLQRSVAVEVGVDDIETLHRSPLALPDPQLVHSM